MARPGGAPRAQGEVDLCGSSSDSTGDGDGSSTGEDSSEDSASSSDIEQGRVHFDKEKGRANALMELLKVSNAVRVPTANLSPLFCVVHQDLLRGCRSQSSSDIEALDLACSSLPRCGGIKMELGGDVLFASNCAAAVHDHQHLPWSKVDFDSGVVFAEYCDEFVGKQGSICARCVQIPHTSAYNKFVNRAQDRALHLGKKKTTS